MLIKQANHQAQKEGSKSQKIHHQKKKNSSKDLFYVPEKNSVLLGLFICFLPEMMVTRGRYRSK